ncbi:MAG: aminodeoxychorismate synthase component I [Dehalococcoidia bacterium]|nr:aminodeoxychorismate synthase component I [Dehalococcoidia bacterium]
MISSIPNTENSNTLIYDLGNSFNLVDLFEEFQDLPYPMLLDSSMEGASSGRFSYLTADPFLVMSSKGKDIKLKSGSDVICMTGNPWDVLDELIKKYHIPRISGLPPFQGGILGYWGYDLVRHLESIPNKAQNDIDVPEMYLGFYDWVLSHDASSGRSFLLSTGLPDTTQISALNRSSQILDRISNAKVLGMHNNGTLPSSQINLESNFTYEEYISAINKIQKYLKAGDSYQVNLSQRLSSKYVGDTWQLYLSLRETNPAPFSAYLNFPEVKILSCSPEEFITLNDRSVSIRPIKGTRPAGSNHRDNRKHEEDLIASEKERAENLMIVDLIRNDLGKVCKIGSVNVPSLFSIEKHPSVIHLVSTVEGELLETASPIDLMKACFPCGSVTGAPKLRSMEIIEELEPVRRNIYCGCIGYISLNGDMGTSIAIRTLCVTDGNLYMQLGGAIVSDSDPYEEYLETFQKGAGIRRAFEK